ncbi:hypothetical protein PAT3040_01989 [Paenibacillus agaridevorans]|uniref:Uncharacterized protein n=1 Tax=Paenibacillus agaridevorans TaxID=171404 RepID=A0A2R5EQY2_9BACL|nr:hypothetical protein PAT3040_01989 [Paenibacillus agaridevorans]
MLLTVVISIAGSYFSNGLASTEAGDEEGESAEELAFNAPPLPLVLLLPLLQADTKTSDMDKARLANVIILFFAKMLVILYPPN